MTFTAQAESNRRERKDNMAQEFSVPLSEIINECELEVLYVPDEPSRIAISSSDVNRAGLQLTGFYEYFDSSRIQIAGKAEYAVLEHFSEEERAKAKEKAPARPTNPSPEPEPEPETEKDGTENPVAAVKEEPVTAESLVKKVAERNRLIIEANNKKLGIGLAETIDLFGTGK